MNMIFFFRERLMGAFIRAGAFVMINMTTLSV